MAAERFKSSLPPSKKSKRSSHWNFQEWEEVPKHSAKRMASTTTMPVMPVLHGPFGGSGGDAFNDLIQLNPSTVLSSGISIKQIKIRAEDNVDSIQVTYRLGNDGAQQTLDHHGGHGGSISTITLEDDEILVKVEGKIYKHLIGQLSFTSQKANGNLKKHGPFGKMGGTPFLAEGIVVAFSGRSGAALDSLSIYCYTLPIQESDEIGGGGGNLWDDIIEHGPKIFDIQSIDISHGNQVDSIQTTYRFFDGSVQQTPRRGGTGARKSDTIQLANGEKLMQIKGKTNGVLVDQLTFHTVCKDGTTKVYGPYGKTGQSHFTFQGPILGFKGRSGNLLDQIGVYYKSENLSYFRVSDLFGGSGGNPWDDNIGAIQPQVVGIKQIIIYSGNQVDGIQVIYCLADGSEKRSEHHGGRGGSQSTITLQEDEQLVRVEGKTNGVLIDQLTFVVKNEMGEKKHGPYGRTGKTPFSVEGHIVGFFGRAGNLLDGLGMYVSAD